MKTISQRALAIASVVSLVLIAGDAYAQTASAPSPSTSSATQSAATQTTSSTPPQGIVPPPAQTATPIPAPPPTPAAPAPRPQGRWVYAAEYGWLWVPEGATTTSIDDVPYVYLYTPGYGWNWYVSPWGWGPFFVGDWVVHPWRPRVWHGWVAAPGIALRVRPWGWHRR